jgi:uncharacterized protein
VVARLLSCHAGECVDGRFRVARERRSRGFRGGDHPSGIVFSNTEERLGTWLALALSALLFALLHLADPDASLTGAIVAGLEGGILLSAAYALTRRLWLPVGIHFAWDISQDAVASMNGLVRANLTIPWLLSGGDSAIEGSILALLFCSMVRTYRATILESRQAKRSSIATRQQALDRLGSSHH